MQREEQKISYLLDKWFVLCQPALPPFLFNWAGIVRVLLQHGRWNDASRVAAEAAEQGYALPPELLEEITDPIRRGELR
jgi:hypothetical protein